MPTRRPAERGSCVTRFLARVEHIHPAEQRGRATVADGRNLPRLSLAAVERPAQAPGLSPANGFHRIPEIGGGGLVGDIAQLAIQPAVANPVEPLPGELKV